jgi:1-acyl-sn-glycerol-3-phosphate acyltransferase
MIIILPLAWLIFLPRIKKRGNVPKSDAVIFAGNHVRSLDPVLILLATWRPVYFLAKIEIFSWAIFGWFAKQIGMIPVNRRAKGKNGAAIDSAVNFLENNKAIGIFPEGTAIKQKNELLPFKFGAVKMAMESGKSIVPFAIFGDYYPFARKINIVFGKPIDVSGMEIVAANDLLRQKVAKLLTDNNQKVIVRKD